jgi:hypothetical protein
MAVDPTQILQDAACIVSCVPQGMIQAAQLGQMVLPSIVTTTLRTGSTGVAQLLLAANPKRRSAIIENIGAAAAVVGNASVTTATGFTITTQGSPATSRLQVFTQGEMYFIQNTGSNMVVMEFLVP